MNEQELAEIKARCEKATPGPWGLVGQEANMIIIDSHCDTLEFSEADVIFCAHARSDIPALIAEVRRLTADKQELAERLAKFTVSTIRLTAENARLRAALEEMKDLLDAYSQDGHDRPIAVAANIADEALKGGNS